MSLSPSHHHIALLQKGLKGAEKSYRTLAEGLGLPFMRLETLPVDNAPHDQKEMHEYIRLRAIPYIRDEDGATLIVTTCPSTALEAWAAERFEHYRLAVTSPYDLYWHFQRHFAEKLDEDSRLALWKTLPHQSARQVITTAQRYGMAATVLLLAAAITFAPVATIIWALLVLNLFYFATLLFKFLLFFCGRLYRPGTMISEAEIRKMEDASLPVYTVLVPLHDEEESLPRLLAALDALDYPADKLDIKLIIEQSDAKTLAALKNLQPDGRYQFIHVPYSLPQTKPKACNYALRFARGEYVTIYDAEDEPDPLQLKKAVYTFRSQPEEVVCLQARLNYYNREEGLLPALFALEYAIWFDYMLPGLQLNRIPIPLGGTSNHLKLEALRALGEWDPYNVTEDADLGIRIAISGYKTAVLDSLTQEEAPPEIRIWLKQRTRWVKGYLQTWLVHMRNPVSLWRELPIPAFTGFQLFIAGPCLVFLTAPLLWLFSLLWMLGWLPMFTGQFSPLLLSLAAFNIGFGLLTHLYYALHVILHYGWKKMGKALILFPLYWFLHSVAAYRAIGQLLRAPHQWEKTPHGFSAKARAAAGNKSVV